ncbi:MAG: hypothetical protein WKG06_34860 [Segetibacter sp.]
MKNKGLRSVTMDLTPRPVLPEKKSFLKLFDDFETGYKKWKVIGEAFGNAPAEGSLGGDQSRLIGFSGKGVVNSFLNGDKTMGKLISESFTIADPYIVFKIGGGNHPKTTCLNLVIDNNVVRTETGKNTEGLDIQSWDVRELTGKKGSFGNYR